MPDDFAVKDSGVREQFDSGMVRDTTEGKTDYSLALDGPMFKRLAEHLTRGAVKYEKRNWMQAAGQAELDRFRESALRHFLQWYDGETDEDHAAAVFFNINGAEYVRERASTSTGSALVDALLREREQASTRQPSPLLPLRIGTSQLPRSRVAKAAPVRFEHDGPEYTGEV